MIVSTKKRTIESILKSLLLPSSISNLEKENLDKPIFIEKDPTKSLEKIFTKEKVN